MILHIPHSSTKIPNYEDEMKHDKNVIKAIEKYTDFRTDELFFYSGCDRIVYPYSRVFCDVEKLEENEPMEELGLGVLYDVSNKTRKHPNKALETYKEHHKKLTTNCFKLKAMLKRVIIIDCHSFSDEQALEQGYTHTPDICLGSDKFHTPSELVDICKTHFELNGYRIGVNTPFEGTIVPLNFYGKDKDILSIMIEVNKRIYANEEDFIRLRECITSLLEKIEYNFY